MANTERRFCRSALISAGRPGGRRIGTTATQAQSWRLADACLRRCGSLYRVVYSDQRDGGNRRAEVGSQTAWLRLELFKSRIAMQDQIRPSDQGHLHMMCRTTTPVH